jgi:hypothetical protein
MGVLSLVTGKVVSDFAKAVERTVNLNIISHNKQTFEPCKKVQRIFYRQFPSFYINKILSRLWKKFSLNFVRKGLVCIKGK